MNLWRLRLLSRLCPEASRLSEGSNASGCLGHTGATRAASWISRRIVVRYRTAERLVVY